MRASAYKIFLKWRKVYVQSKSMESQKISDTLPEMLQLQREMNRLFSNVGQKSPQDYPAVNIWEKDGNAVITAELPGIDPEKWIFPYSETPLRYQEWLCRRPSHRARPIFARKEASGASNVIFNSRFRSTRRRWRPGMKRAY